MKKIENVQAKLNEFDLLLCNSDSVLKNKYLCSNSNGSLTWYYNLEHLNPEVIVHSDTASGCGYSLNTETITVREAPSASGGFFLHFLLRDKSGLQLFKKLATDLIENSNLAESGEEGISLIVDRFTMWKHMLKHQGDEKGIKKGLIGELITIKRLLENGVNERDVVESWGGPEMVQQDFILPNYWIETKTIGPSASVVTINSIGQLDKPDLPGYLYIVKIEDASAGEVDSISILGLYNQICNILKAKDIDSYSLFKNKMKQFEYDRFCLENDDVSAPYYCKILNENVYVVENDFPRLLNEYNRIGIKSVHYDLLLSVIEAWRINEGVAIWK